MSSDPILDRISSMGTVGIKKTDLRKEFGEMEIDVVLQRLLTSGDIFVDKKGTAYYCWHKDFYLQNLLNIDPKFRLIYQAVKHLDLSINTIYDNIQKNIERFDNNFKKIEKFDPGMNLNGISKVTINNEPTMDLEKFRNDFDMTVANHSSSIGWVDLSKVRNELCKKYNISTEYFYTFVEQLMNLYHDKYELSTGGYEGLTVRGLLHGFVRCI